MTFKHIYCWTDICCRSRFSLLQSLTGMGSKTKSRRLNCWCTTWQRPTLARITAVRCTPSAPRWATWSWRSDVESNWVHLLKVCALVQFWVFLVHVNLYLRGKILLFTPLHLSNSCNDLLHLKILPEKHHYKMSTIKRVVPSLFDLWLFTKNTWGHFWGQQFETQRHKTLQYFTKKLRLEKSPIN